MLNANGLGKCREIDFDALDECRKRVDVNLFFLSCILLSDLRSGFPCILVKLCFNDRNAELKIKFNDSVRCAV